MNFFCLIPMGSAWLTAIRINPIVKPSQNTQTSNLNAASTAALFDFAIELSYGDPGETKRLRV